MARARGDDVDVRALGREVADRGVGHLLLPLSIAALTRWSAD